MATDDLQRTLDAQTFQIKNLGDPTQADDATKTDNTTAPVNPGASPSAGASFKAAPANHAHQGVHAVKSTGGANIYGDVEIAAGTGIDVNQSGQIITISTDAAAVNKVTWAEDLQSTVTGTAEEIIREYNVAFDDAGGVNIQARLSALVNVAAGTGTYRLYVGATAPGSTAGGTVRATLTSTSTTFEKQTDLGAAFANPGGSQIVQIALVNSGNNKTRLRGLQVAIG